MNLFQLRGKPVTVTVNETGGTLSIPLFTIDDFRDLSVKLQAKNILAMSDLTPDQLGIDKKKGKDQPEPSMVLKARIICGLREISEEEIRAHIRSIEGSTHVVATCMSRIEGWDKAKADDFANRLTPFQRADLAWLLCGYNGALEELTTPTPTDAEAVAKGIKTPKK